METKIVRLGINGEGIGFYQRKDDRFYIQWKCDMWLIRQLFLLDMGNR